MSMEAMDQNWECVHIRKEHHTTLRALVASHPAYETVDEYIDSILRVLLREERPEMNAAEIEAVSDRLAALGYL